MLPPWAAACHEQTPGEAGQTPMRARVTAPVCMLLALKTLAIPKGYHMHELDDL